MVRKEMSKTSLIPAEKKLAASKTRLKIMLQGLNRMCEESEKAVVIKGQLSLVEKLFQETDALQSAYEEALEAEEQQASMIEWPGTSRNCCTSGLKGERERLTELKMPVFSGKVLDFPAFWDRFQGSVHSRTDWDDASKFAYLLSSLSGVALAAVEGMPSSGCDRAGIREGNLERQTVFRPVSGSGTQALIDEIQRHLRCLSALGKGLSTGEMTASEAFLPMLKERFPEEIRLAWDIRVQSASGVKGDLREFLEFAQVRTAARLAAAATSDGGRLVKRDESEQHEPGSGRQERHRTPQTEQRAGKANTTVLHMVVISSCPICDGGHDIATCEKFLKAEVHTRSLMAARCKLCFRCLQSGHRAKACKVRRKCTVSGCRGSRHRLLHRSQSPSPDQTPDALKSRGCMLIAGGGAKQVRLQSVRARAVGKDGLCMVVHCLFDPASQSSFIRKDVADALELAGSHEVIRLVTVDNDGGTKRRMRRVEFHLEAVDPAQSRTRYPIQALVLPKICGKIRQAPVKLTEWPHLSNLPIADQREKRTFTIDVLIGLDHYFNLVGGDVRRGSTGGPVAVHSQLGWILCGETNRRRTTAVTTLLTRVEESADQILENMYVDDLATSCDSIEEANELAGESRGLLASGGFHLHKWASNEPGALASVPDEERSASSKSHLWKTLGLQWDRRDDHLTFSPPAMVNGQGGESKRTMLSTAFHLIDPVGCLAPFTVRAKMLLQTLWQPKTSWDEPLPHDVKEQWRRWKQELPDLLNLRLPRALVPVVLGQVKGLELHVFCDATEKAYGAVAYIRIEATNHHTVVYIAAAKMRVAPICRLTLSWLELMGALVAARLVRSVQKMLEIQHLVEPAAWRHCPGRQNPADLPSRGTMVPKLLESPLWWHGPKWLACPRNAWSVGQPTVEEVPPMLVTTESTGPLESGPPQQRSPGRLPSWWCWNRPLKVMGKRLPSGGGCSGRNSRDTVESTCVQGDGSGLRWMTQ
ncbi:hypothetical protein T10_7615 [Trichinella papuae]|uniref:CCHC-type domain-containing protein n=1 Tax=Trichinella papuae TaxID=268474 RepID=A0A0V1N253_9BILA|nr:hypothetical protein T10_7615 [Trichinella papuae]